MVLNDDCIRLCLPPTHAHTYTHIHSLCYRIVIESVMRHLPVNFARQMHIIVDWPDICIRSEPTSGRANIICSYARQSERNANAFQVWGEYCVDT